jgi:hypothetical protein
MKPVETPKALDPETVDALTTVRAWSRAFNARDVDALVALSTGTTLCGGWSIVRATASRSTSAR